MAAPKKTKKPNIPSLTEIRFTKEQLMQLPEEERELLMRVGLVSNDVLLFQRLWAAFIYRVIENRAISQKGISERDNTSSYDADSFRRHCYEPSGCRVS